MTNTNLSYPIIIDHRGLGGYLLRVYGVTRLRTFNIFHRKIDDPMAHKTKTVVNPEMGNDEIMYYAVI